MNNTKQNNLQILSIVFAGIIGLFSAAEPFLLSDILSDNAEHFLYILIGSVSALFVLYYVFQGRLQKEADTWIFFSLFAYAFLVSWWYYGFSKELFSSRFYVIWLTFLFLFFAMRIIKNPDVFIKSFSVVYIVIICVLGVIILVRATMSLRNTFPGNDRLLGCFCAGRLCGLGNANKMSFHCLGCLMLSVYRLFKANPKQRIFYGGAIVLMWFLMGLNNCRTAVFAFALTIALFLFVLIRNRLTKKGTNEIAKFVIAISAAFATALIIILLFMAPLPIYRSVVTLTAKASNNQQILDSLSSVYSRSITNIDTLADRRLIWIRSLELIFKNPRRTLFGVSVISTEGISGVYEGRHDIPLTFAHNMFLEVFRKLGLIGLFIWITLLFIWGKKAVRFFNVEQNTDDIYLMSAAAGVLLTGITESGPFPFAVAASVPYVFFLCCGRAMRNDVYEKTYLT